MLWRWVYVNALCWRIMYLLWWWVDELVKCSGGESVVFVNTLVANRRELCICSGGKSANCVFALAASRRTVYKLWWRVVELRLYLLWCRVVELRLYLLWWRGVELGLYLLWWQVGELVLYLLWWRVGELDLYLLWWRVGELDLIWWRILGSTCLYVPAGYTDMSRWRHNVPAVVCRAGFWFVSR